MPLSSYATIFGISDCDDNLSEIIGENLTKIRAYSIASVGEKNKKGKIDVANFAKRLEKGLLYMVGWESDSEGIDFGKTLNKIQETGFIEYCSNNFK